MLLKLACAHRYANAVALAMVTALGLPGAATAADIAWHQATRPKVINTPTIAREGTATFKDGSTATVRVEGAFDKKVESVMRDPKAASDLKDAQKLQTFKAKSMLKFKDGATITIRYAGKVDPASFASSGSGEFVGGTGRYKGIKGTVTFDGRVSDSEWVGQYSLPKK
jgi:hypothetical protein